MTSVTARLVCYAPDGDRLGDLPFPASWSASLPSNDTSALNLSYPRAVQGSELLESACEVAVEVSRSTAWTEPRNARFLRLEASEDRAKQNADVLSYAMPGYASIMDGIPVLPASLNAGAPYDTDGKRKFLSASIGQILASVLGEARTLTPGLHPGLKLGFSPTRDSASKAWSKRTTIYLEPGLSLLTLLDNLSSQGLCDWWMEGRTLHVVNPESTAQDRGVDLPDRSLMSESPVRSSLAGLRHTVLLAGDEGRTWRVDNPGAPTPWGTSITVLTQGGVRDEATARGMAASELAAGSRERVEYTASMPAGVPGAPLPGVDINPGDYVYARNKTDQRERMRVFACTLDFDKDGLGIALTLNDRFVDAQVREAKRQKGIRNGASGDAGTGAAPIPPRPENAVPKAPEGLVTSGSGYWDDEGQPRGQATVSWGPVTQDTRGNAIDIDHYTVRVGAASMTTIAATVTVADLPIGRQAVWVGAVSRDGVQGPYAVGSVTTVRPPKRLDPPTTPVLSCELGMVTVAWDGKLLPDGGQPVTPPLHFARTQVQEAASPTGPWATVGTVVAGELLLDRQDSVDATRWYRLVAVDRLGTASDPSQAVSIVVSNAVVAELRKRQAEAQQDLDQAAKDLAALKVSQQQNASDLSQAAEDLAALKAAQQRNTTELDQAAEDLAAAKTRLDQNVQAVAQAASQAQAATDAAETAQQAADQTKTLVAATQTKLAQAASDLAAAKARIDQTATSVTQARSVADQAVAAAKKAQTTADAAQDDADTAKDAAARAAGVADSKADVLIQSSQPATAMRKPATLWIDTTNGANTPKRWSGSAWVAVTDKKAIDAANAAAAAKARADQGVRDAAAAKTAADRAQATALAAQSDADTAAAKATTADGRYTVATANPTSRDATGKPQGAVWEVRSGAVSLRRYVLAGTAWQPVKIGPDFVGLKAIGRAQIGDAAIGTAQIADAAITDAKIGNLTVGKLTATGGAKFSDAVIDTLVGQDAFLDKLTTSRLLVGNTSNLIPNGDLSSGNIRPFHPEMTLSTSVPPPSAISTLKYSLQYGGKQRTLAPAQPNTTWPMIPGAKYLFECWIKANKPGSVFYLELRSEPGGALCIASKVPAKPGADMGGAGVYLLSRYTVPTTWTRIQAIITLKEGVTSARLGNIYFNHTDGSVRDATINLAGLRLTPITPGVLIEDGAITANKVAANAIASDKIQASAITAGKIAAGAVTATSLAAGSVIAPKIAAGAVTADKLAANSVIASKIAAGAVTTEKLAARSVTADELAVGAVTATNLAAGSVIAPKIAAGAINAEKLAANSVTANAIAAGQVTTPKIATGAVTANELAANSVIADKIASSAITTGKIAAQAVTAREIAARAVTASALSADALNFKTATGMTLTSSVIRTSAVPYRGITIDGKNNRLTAYNNSGVGMLYVDTNTGYLSVGNGAMTLNNGNLSITGALQTAANDNSVIINSNAYSNTTAGIRFQSRGASFNLSPIIWGGTYGLFADGPRIDTSSLSRLELTKVQASLHAGPYNESTNIVNIASQVAVGRTYAKMYSTGNTTIDGNTVTITSPQIRLQQFSNMYWEINREHPLQMAVGDDLDNSWNYMPLTSVAANLTMDRWGILYRSTSASRYKLNQERLTIDPDAAYQLVPKTWIDKALVDEMAKGDSVRTIDDLIRTPGLVAEDVENIGLRQFVTYGTNGQPEGLMYDRLWIALIPAITALRDRIIALENTLKGKTL